MKKQLENVFHKNEQVLIGVVHLPPLLSLEGHPGMDALIEKAQADVAALMAAGFDGALLENEHDKPHTEFANPAQIASMSVIAQEVRKIATIPVGVQMMLNDWQSSIAIAKAADAQFIRLDVFVDHVDCQWGEIHPDPEEIMAYKNELYPELVMLTDIQVKYKTMLQSRPLGDSAKEAIEHGSDALIITGNATGEETPLESIAMIKEQFSEFPVFVGAGITKENIQEQFAVADGAIVGTSIKTGKLIDAVKAAELKEQLEK